MKRNRTFSIYNFCVMLLCVICVLSVLVLPAFAEPAEDMPDWYDPDFSPADVYHNDPSEPRVVDNAGVFSEAEYDRLSRQLESMRNELNMDFVLLTDDSYHGQGYIKYATDFYDMNGYGLGDDFSGVIFFLCFEPGDRGFEAYGTGRAEKYMTERNVDKMSDKIMDHMVDGNYAKGVETYFSQLRTLIKKGRLPLSGSQIAALVIIPSLIGLIGGGISLSSAKASMRTVVKATTAAEYLNPISFVVNGSVDNLINTDVSRTFIDRSSSSGGRSGGSSYHSGFHSSGGHSFSGGGRRF
ncbi:MAG: TPM domain-containing protein [Clostridia bacterium]|nr:TPM domain-containing protein [Clostridia bacterium]